MCESFTPAPNWSPPSIPLNDKAKTSWNSALEALNPFVPELAMLSDTTPIPCPTAFKPDTPMLKDLKIPILLSLLDIKF